ncbi:uncharacterized protein [Amphiura filiformis]|uniref:uncharacterized protein n=1 Tax=Amphiura filiformis TaxID=82378 RepID=UPI003B212C4F
MPEHRTDPPSIKLKSSVKGMEASNILKKTESKLLGERIRQTVFTLGVIKRQYEELETTIRSHVSRDLANRLAEVVERSRNRNTGSARCVKYYDRLREKSSPVLDTTLSQQQERWVVNKSDRELNDDEKSLLAKGMNYAVSPTSIPTIDLITGVELACNKLTDKTEKDQVRAEAVKVIGSSHAPKSNLTPGERKAMKNLRTDESVTILPSDKGRCTVVLNTTDHKQKVDDLLSDANTYTLLKRDPTRKYKEQLRGILKRLCDSDRITKAQYYLLMPSSDTVPRFYGLPKVHKPLSPLRPIVSSIGSVTYQVAKFVADIIAPLVDQSPHHIKNSADFAERMGNLTLHEGEIMVSYDVTGLFTNTPVPDALRVIRRRLEEDVTLPDRTTLSVDDVMELLTFCATSTYMMGLGKIYQQREVFAMGFPVSPLASNIFMEWFEVRALDTAPHVPS